ncbi:hypothetical protein L3Q82_023607 [Scortum barcoo]|uniref:Uncharacterized protein n=1 Tax=Scortum barcoo TaxID=214431 RepID=A0ACB8WVP9_9TELE|nr:hypothetical protein L3Q82_023607 [Scortum barcoo]
MCYSKRPCRSVLMLNAIHEAIITKKNRGADGPRQLLLVVILLCLNSDPVLGGDVSSGVNMLLNREASGTGDHLHRDG